MVLSIGLAITGFRSQLAFADVPSDAQRFSFELKPESLAAWRDHILPATAELDFQKIPWLTTFKDGIIEADRQNRPLLLWTMNGHPLGCT